LYNGPAKPGLLSQMRGNSAVDTGVIAAYSDLKLDTLVDYPSPFGAWFLCGGFSKVVILCTNFLHGVLGYIHLVFPYGLAIIVLTVLIRLMLFPLTRGQAISSMRMQALAPELKEMQAKYGNDRQKMAQAQMELYRKNGINPLAGCLPMLLQMPIMMGLYFALQESVFFRLAPVGMTWIHNLAAPDMLLEWGDKIPWISRPSDYGGFIYLGPYLNLLPLFAMGLMVVQQKMFMPPPTSDEQKQQQDMMMVMSVIMSVMFYRVPSGLCLYFIVSSLWGLAERRLLPKSQPLASIVVKAANKPAKTEKKPGQESIIERFQRFIREAGENPRT
jgi:YidC/Oxa1 family membrane protein insertase